MRNFIRLTLLSGVLLIGTPVFSQVSVGIRIGAPPPPRVIYVHPVSPGREYVWIDGYWYPVGKHYKWHEGYWTRPPYRGARWVPPHHDGQHFYSGYWNGNHGQYAHDHHWDGKPERDYDRYPNGK
jgi:hypothetical protein